MQTYSGGAPLANPALLWRELLNTEREITLDIEGKPGCSEIFSHYATRCPSAFNIVQEAFENAIEIVRRFLERRVSKGRHAMTTSLPQISIGDGVDIGEIDHSIFCTIHDCERNRGSLYGQALVSGLSGACRLEAAPAETAVRARHRITQNGIRRRAEDCFDKTMNVGLGKILRPRGLKCDERLKHCAMFFTPTGCVPVIISPRMPGKRVSISIPIRPPSDQPNTTASLTRSGCA
ncbi:hypothetical protein AB4Y45_07105 [Paraburkholderia sp. EG287A]|uniref:hypothetical protein n=1 Tax=unclassified Paraburkholderia TaxID=2615204 RepID=UPI0034D16FAF